MEHSGLGRILSVFTNPGATFRSIAERPTWAAPLVVFLVVIIALGFVVHQRTDYHEVTEWSMAKRGQEVSAEQLEGIVELQEKFGGVGAVIGGVIGIGFIFLITLVYWVLLKVLGGELSYQQALSVNLYSSMPVAVMSLLSIAVLLPEKGISPERLMSRTFLVSNLAFLAPDDAGAVLTNLLASFDFFTLWSVVLAVIGYKIAARVSTGMAATAVLIVFLLGVGLRVGLAALGGLG